MKKKDSKRRGYLNRLTINSDGVILDNTIEVTAFTTEPNYAKTYTDYISIPCNMSHICQRIINMLLKYIDYNNEVVLSHEIKIRISKELDVMINTFEHGMADLLKDDNFPIIKICNNHYIINPMFFGKGKYKDLIPIIEKYKLLIEEEKKKREYRLNNPKPKLNKKKKDENI